MLSIASLVPLILVVLFLSGSLSIDFSYPSIHSFISRIYIYRPLTPPSRHMPNSNRGISGGGQSTKAFFLVIVAAVTPMALLSNVDLTDYHATNIVRRDKLVRILFVSPIHPFIQSVISSFVCSFIHFFVSDNYLGRLFEHEQVGGRINIPFLFVSFLSLFQSLSHR